MFTLPRLVLAERDVKPYVLDICGSPGGNPDRAGAPDSPTAQKLVQADLDLVDELLAERRAEAAAKDVAEVAQKIRAHGRNRDLAKVLFASYGMRIEPVTAADAEWATRRWTTGEGLSLADRLCMAPGDRLYARVWTADQAWGPTGGYVRFADLPGLAGRRGSALCR